MADVVSDLREGNVEIGKTGDYLLCQNALAALCGKIDGETLRINPNDVVYFEASGHDVFIRLSNGKEASYSEGLIHIEGILPPNFIRISASYIVNILQIQSLSPSLSHHLRLRLKNGGSLFVNRSYYKAFKERIGF